MSEQQHTEVPVWIVRLAADFLTEYGERLGNDRCNDYDVPDWVPIDDLRAIIVSWCGGDEVESEGLENYNWAVVDAIANELLLSISPLNTGKDGGTK